MRARYADGRAAVTHDADCAFGADAAIFEAAGARHEWRYAELSRADDGNGEVALKRKPDSGERLILDREAARALRSAAPGLFTARARGVEPPGLVIGLAAAAFSLAGIFLIGVPLSAGPIADAMPMQYREQISDISWSQVNAVADYCDDSDEAAQILNAMAHRMMAAAGVTRRDAIWIVIVDAPFPNAFALPDETIVLTAPLIALAEHPDEIAGVLAHEIAHVERNHVMKNIVGNMGAGIFFDVVFGGQGVGQAIAIASVNLAGLRYSRGYEREADARGLDYLDAAGIDTGAIAALFERLREYYDIDEAEDIPTLLATHPSSRERAAQARARSRPGLDPSLTEREWRILRAACGGRAGQADDAARAAREAPPPPAPPQPPKPEDGKRLALPSRADAG